MMQNHPKETKGYRKEKQNNLKGIQHDYKDMQKQPQRDWTLLQQHPRQPRIDTKAIVS